MDRPRAQLSYERTSRGALVGFHTGGGAAERRLEHQGQQAPAQRHAVGQRNVVHIEPFQGRPGLRHQRRIGRPRRFIVSGPGPQGAPADVETVEDLRDRRHPWMAGRHLLEKETQVIAQFPRRHDIRDVAALVGEFGGRAATGRRQAGRPAGPAFARRAALLDEGQQAGSADGVGDQMDPGARRVVVHAMPAPGVEDPAFAGGHVDFLPAA